MNLNDMARKLKGLVKFLIDWDDDVNVTNEYEDGKAPLHDTEHQGYIKIAELLIKNGANVNVGSGSSQFFEITNVANLIINVANEYGETPLYEATRFGLTEIAELLLKNGADVNIATKYGATPLHVATSFGNKKISELLIKKG